MKRILSLFHSGVGNTKLVAERITSFLQSKKIAVKNFSVEHFYSEKINDYEFLIIGFPTYFLEASKVMNEFIASLPRYEKQKYAFIYTTCGLFSANTLYNFAGKLHEKNIHIVHSAVYRCPATDFVLIMPSFRPTLSFENNLQSHIERDLKRTFYCFKNREINPPEFKLYSLLTKPMEAVERKNTIQINNDLCTVCGKCVRNCPHKCFSKNDNGISFEIENCENCYRCIHHCPARALSLNGKTPKILFDNAFYMC
ncbi:MAG: EFR1 family ferrodoxin [Ruminococcus sp.]|jgi:ferredoxin/flavodoxin|nr:EFR1 family ferrodoxin [Ruminococcus sp.]